MPYSKSTSPSGETYVRGFSKTPCLSETGSGSIGAAGGFGLVVDRLVFNLDVLGGAGLALHIVIDAFAYVAADAAQFAALIASPFILSVCA